MTIVPYSFGIDVSDKFYYQLATARTDSHSKGHIPVTIAHLMCLVATRLRIS